MQVSTIKISNVAQFKKAIKVGTLLHCIHMHLGSMGIRPVSIAQSNSFALKTTKGQAKEVGMFNDSDNYTTITTMQFFASICYRCKELHYCK